MRFGDLAEIKELLSGDPQGEQPAPIACARCGAPQEYLWARMIGRWVVSDRCIACVDHQARQELGKREVRTSDTQLAYERAIAASGVQADRFRRFADRRWDADAAVLALVGGDVPRSGWISGSRQERQLSAAVLTETYLNHQIRTLGRTGAQALVLHEPDLYRRLKLGFDGGKGALQLAEVQAVELLVVDGLGDTETTAWERETMRRVLDEREACERPTILLGSCSWEDLLTTQPYRELKRVLESWMERKITLAGFERKGGWSEPWARGGDV